MDLPYFPIPELIVLTLVIIALIPTAKEAWTRCITANWANLTEHDHRDRANTWRGLALGFFITAIFVGIMAGLPLLNPKNEAPITYPFMVLGLMIIIMGPPWIPVYLHERHLDNGHEDEAL